MNIMHFFNGISYLAVSAISFYLYRDFSRRGEIERKVGNIIGVGGIFHFLMAFLNLMWVFNMLEENPHDFIIMQVVLAAMSSALILYAVYKITGKTHLIYLLFLFATTLYAINFSLNAFFIASLAVSYFLVMIVFLELSILSNYYLRLAGYYGLSYGVLSTIFSTLLLLGVEPGKVPWFLPMIGMALSLVFIYLDVRNLGITKDNAFQNRKRIPILNYVEVFAKFLIFIISINGFLLVSTIAIHELGHALVAQYYGCEQFKAVIYDISSPHTEIKCGGYYNDAILTLAGIMITSVAGLVFAITGNKYAKGFSFLIFGYGLLIAYSDLLVAGISQNMAIVVFVGSLLTIIITVVKLCFSYLHEEEIFKMGEDNKPQEDAQAKKI